MIVKEYRITSAVLLPAYWTEGKDESDYRIKSLACENVLRPGTLAYRRVRSLMLGETGVNPLIGGTTPETFTNFFQMFHDTRHEYVMHDLIQDTGEVMDGMLYELVRQDGQCYLLSREIRSQEVYCSPHHFPLVGVCEKSSSSLSN